MFYPSFLTNKMERFSFKSGCVLRVAKHLKKTGSQCSINNYGLKQLLKSIIANVLKFKASLKTKFKKCVYVTTYVFLSDESLLT